MEQHRPLSNTGRRLVGAVVALGLVAVAVTALIEPDGLAVPVAIAVVALILGAVLWWFGTDASRGWDDVGRGLVMSAVFAAIAGLVQHEIDQGEKRRALELSLSQSQNLSGAELSGEDLESFRLQGKNLTQADLSGTHLDDANLYGANLSSADLRGAHLTDADLRHADLGGADLRGADLTGARLGGANLNVALLAGARLRRAHLVSATMRSACFASSGTTRRTDLTRAQLAGADLTGAVLTGAELGKADFEADLQPATLDGAGFAGARATGTDWPLEFNPKAALAGRPAPQPGAKPGRTTPRGAFAAQVTLVEDGDTVLLEDPVEGGKLPLKGFGRARLAGINAPPPGTATGQRARNRVNDLIGGLDVRVELAKPKPDRSRRYLVYIWIRQGLLNRLLIQEGLASVLASGRKPDVERDFAAQQTRAKQQGKGRWGNCAPAG